MKILIALHIAIFSNIVLATPQIMDSMTFESETLQILNDPLKPILSGHSKEWHEEVWLKEAPEFECSASWRGYYSEWSISLGKLYLIGVFSDPCSQSPELIQPNILFAQDSYPIFAVWFTGEIPVQTGDTKFVEDVVIDGELRDTWYKCTTRYFKFERGKYKGSEIRESFDDCYVF